MSCSQKLQNHRTTLFGMKCHSTPLLDRSSTNTTGGKTSAAPLLHHGKWTHCLTAPIWVVICGMPVAGLSYKYFKVDGSGYHTIEEGNISLLLSNVVVVIQAPIKSTPVTSKGHEAFT